MPTSIRTPPCTVAFPSLEVCSVEKRGMDRAHRSLEKEVRPAHQGSRARALTQVRAHAERHRAAIQARAHRIGGRFGSFAGHVAHVDDKLRPQRDVIQIRRVADAIRLVRRQWRPQAP